MPRWSRDSAALGARYPDERWTGLCPRADAELLIRYDHHVVWVGGRAALLLTYASGAAESAGTPGPLACEVSFTYPRGHPRAPREVQSVVDRIQFAPVEPRDGAG